MTLSTEDYIAAITAHSAGFAEAVRGNLDARVEHCPDWSVADLVAHLTGVHWFWATIAEELPAEPPDPSRRPARAPDDQLVDVFLGGAQRLADVLRDADQSAACWTWAPHQQDVAFVTRHQVQEAAVHHWDAVNAAGGRLEIEPGVAVDAVEEFLTFSVSSEADPADPPRPALDGAFSLRASDTGDGWTIADATQPGTLVVTPGAGQPPYLDATAAELLLWLYGRVDLDTAAGPDDLLARFRAHTSPA